MKGKTLKKYIVKMTDRSVSLLPVYALLLVGLLCMGAGIYYFTMKYVHIPVRPHVDQQKKLDAMFLTEPLPIAPEDKDPLNYGLEDSATDTPAVSGDIFFTGQIAEHVPVTSVWFIDAASSTASSTKFIPQLPFSSMITFTSVEKPTNTFYLSTITQASQKAETDHYGIHRVNLDTGMVDYLYRASSTAERNLALSPNGQVLAYSHVLGSLYSADFYKIPNLVTALLSVGDNKLITSIDEATQPKWSPDGSKLLILKTDGIYVYDIKTGGLTKAISVAGEGELLASTMFDVSPDGKSLVITSDKAGLITMYSITSWDPFTITEVGRIHTDKTEYYWPKFSPDSNYYVVQAIDAPTDGPASRLNARFEIRPTTGRTIVRSYKIGQFDFNHFFTDTWIKQLPTPSSTASSSKIKK